MSYGLRSIRWRIIALSGLLTLLLLGSVVHTEVRVREAADRSLEDVARQQSFTADIADLKNTVYAMESSLYRYVALQDEVARTSVEHLFQETTKRSAALRDSPVVSYDEDLRRSFDTLMLTLALVEREVRELQDIVANTDKQFPGSPIITNNLYPLNVTFTTALEDALLSLDLEAANGMSRTAKNLLQEVRYLWSQQISAVRLFIANRSGMLGAAEAKVQQQLQDRDHYMTEIRRQLSVLRQLAKPAQYVMLRNSLSVMTRTTDEYEKNFNQMVQVYQSENWRGDVTELRTSIQPLFGELNRNFNAIEARLGAMGSEGVMGPLRLTEELTDFLWRIVGVMVLLLTLGYLVYERTIRRPIDQVIMALQALGKGEAYTPLLKTYALETDALLQSFREMQNQVNSREMRLASILDNASDGIITINDHGLIETFNNAAETLFGYEADEIIGKSVNILMPPPMRDEHDAYIRRYLDTGEQRIIGNEMNVSAQRKDGAVFPMSIKVSEMVLDGKRYFTAIVSDISERKAMLDNLRHMAEHDSLTGLYNRQYFTDELERVMLRSLRQKGLNCALLYIDLDNFKYVNDTLGHLAGDRVLVEVANLITKRSRKSDMIARLGGDEFAVLLYDVDMNQALATAEDYRQQMAEYSFRHEGRVVDIGCSIGLAMFDPDVASREELMARADISCHMAKRAGRNSVHAYRADDRVNMDSMLADIGWTRRIKEAIEQDGFVFALQPIVAIGGREVVSYELLLRMRGDNDEIIMPSGFMPSAERFGLILDIDRWVVRHAIDWLAGEQIGNDVRLSINLSAMAVGDAEVLQLIHDRLALHDIDPRRLTFEITESIAMADLGAAVNFLASLRDLGCTTALDDFGAGYSSFAYLKDLPVDYVKIDGSFVRDIARDAVQLAMVKSMNDIAHALGKLTVAEYVEDEAVLQLLSAGGVDFAQGYLTGRPQLIELSAAA